MLLRSMPVRFSALRVWLLAVPPSAGYGPTISCANSVQESVEEEPLDDDELVDEDEPLDQVPSSPAPPQALRNAVAPMAPGIRRR